MSLDDVLVLVVMNSTAGLTIVVQTRLLRADGTISVGSTGFNPTTDRTRNTFTIALAEGYLLSAQLFANFGTPRRGSTYCEIQLVRGLGVGRLGTFTLLSDYLTTNLTLGWPTSRIGQSVEGPGIMRSIVGTTPAAGAEISETVPTGARWRLRGIRYQLTTAVAVANRESGLLYDDGVNAFLKMVAGFSQVASLVHTYNFGLGLTLVDSTVSADHTRSAGACDLLAGFRIRTSTVNLQAADAYTAPNYEVEEWIEG